MTELPNRLRELRQQRGLTQETLALLVGVERQAVIAWEAGRAKPHPRHAKLLARRLGVAVDDLRFGGSADADREARLRQRRQELLDKQHRDGHLRLAELRELQTIQSALRGATPSGPTSAEEAVRDYNARLKREQRER